MAYRAIYVALLFSCLPLAGCGTIGNLLKPGPVQGGKTPFGGVRQDVSCMKAAANGESGSETPADSQQHRQVGRMLCYAVDLPFTVVGDVLTWPYTVSYTFINQPVPPPPLTPATNIGRPQTSPPAPY